jgi:hypothetical protein
VNDQHTTGMECARNAAKSPFGRASSYLNGPQLHDYQTSMGCKQTETCAVFHLPLARLERVTCSGMLSSMSYG